MNFEVQSKRVANMDPPAVQTPSDQHLCYVRCNFCNTLLAVGIPCKRLLDTAAFSSDFKRGQSSSSSSSTSNEPTSPKAPPFVVKPPERKHRLPSAYNRFMKEEIQRIKASNPQIPHREAFSTAAKNWAGHIPDGSVSGSINTVRFQLLIG
ncbi:hypothetical protein SSX86_028828 [Deinandra increscens subsp. villosa]|uniref:Uncharacterized protein n=1 Tax=Deinandra increscens subsp. villosa TaxID=3103831 RepID=A0AAP0GLQ8_9ASTR